MAINRHGGFTWFYLAAACVSVAAGAVLARHWGALGMAGAAFALELVMIVQVWLLALRLKMFDAQGLREAWTGLRGELRRRGLVAKDRKL
jgi:O-antigen/teichoic acid export membrane protein